jgi:hypothetical protein
MISARLELKVIKIVDSCKTIDQLDTCIQWLHRLARQNNEGWEFYTTMSDILFNRKMSWWENKESADETNETLDS